MLEGFPVLRSALMLFVFFLLLAGELSLELVGGCQVRFQGAQIRVERGQLVVEGRDVGRFQRGQVVLTSFPSLLLVADGISDLIVYQFTGLFLVVSLLLVVLNAFLGHPDLLLVSVNLALLDAGQGLKRLQLDFEGMDLRGETR